MEIKKAMKLIVKDLLKRFEGEDGDLYAWGQLTKLNDLIDNPDFALKVYELDLNMLNKH